MTEGEPNRGLVVVAIFSPSLFPFSQLRYCSSCTLLYCSERVHDESPELRRRARRASTIEAREHLLQNCILSSDFPPRRRLKLTACGDEQGHGKYAECETVRDGKSSDISDRVGEEPQRAPPCRRKKGSLQFVNFTRWFMTRRRLRELSEPDTSSPDSGILSRPFRSTNGLERCEAARGVAKGCARAKGERRIRRVERWLYGQARTQNSSTKRAGGCGTSMIRLYWQGGFDSHISLFSSRLT